jgi:hypothetical protein
LCIKYGLEPAEKAIQPVGPEIPEPIIRSSSLERIPSIEQQSKPLVMIGSGA